MRERNRETIEKQYFLSFFYANRLFKIVSKTSIVCSMEKSESMQTLTHLLVVIDDNTKLRLNQPLLIVADPTVSPLLDEYYAVFKRYLLCYVST